MRTSNIAIYNAVLLDHDTVFVRNQFKNVWVVWRNKLKTSEQYNAENAGVIVRILLSSISAKEYIEPKKLNYQNIDKYYSLQLNDLVVRGLCDEEMASKNDLLQKYDVAQIVNITDNRDKSSTLSHWKLECV